MYIYKYGIRWNRWNTALRVKWRIVKNWSRLITCKTKKLSYFTFKFKYSLYTNNIYHSPWILFIKKIRDCGLSGVWQSQTISNRLHLFNNTFLQRFRDHFIQQWNSDIDNSPKSINLTMIKRSWLTTYHHLPPALWIPLCKFICRHYRLSIEKRYTIHFMPYKRSGRRVSIMW